VFVLLVCALFHRTNRRQNTVRLVRRFSQRSVEKLHAACTLELTIAHGAVQSNGCPGRVTAAILGANMKLMEAQTAPVCYAELQAGGLL
jgi:hypothetical protein